MTLYQISENGFALMNKWLPVLKIENHEYFALKANSSWTLRPMWFKLHRNVSNSQVYSNDEFNLWPVYSGERFRAFRPSCFKIHALAKEEKSFEGFSTFSSGDHLVQWHGTVWAILEESYPRNIPLKLFQNLSTDLAAGVVKSLFLFIALAAILFDRVELFEQFW